MRVGLSKESDLRKALKEFQKLNPEVPLDLTKSKELVKSKPPETPQKQKGGLEVNHHGIKKRGSPGIIISSAPCVNKYLT